MPLPEHERRAAAEAGIVVFDGRLILDRGWIEHQEKAWGAGLDALPFGLSSHRRRSV